MAKRPVQKYDFTPFGKAIKSARNEQKESRNKVGNEMFLSPRYLANIENKGQHPKLLPLATMKAKKNATNGIRS